MYYFPYCGNALYLWKQTTIASFYKCCNRRCPHRIEKLSKLKSAEKLTQKMAPNHFKINYQYREYHFTQDQIRHASPKPSNSKVDILKIHNSDNILGLALAFYIAPLHLQCPDRLSNSSQLLSSCCFLCESFQYVAQRE